MGRKSSVNKNKFKTTNPTKSKKPTIPPAIAAGGPRYG